MIYLIGLICAVLSGLSVYLWNWVQELDDRVDALEATLENHGIYDDGGIR